MKPHNVIHLFDYVKSLEPKKALSIKRSTPEMEQISLPFAAPHTLLMAMAQDFNSADVFSRFATTAMPSLILDMRIAPRLDFIGSNRAHSFTVLKSLDIEYRDMLGRSGIKSYEEPSEDYYGLWSSLVSVLDPIAVNDRPILLFFDNPFFLSFCQRSLESIYDVTALDSQDIEAIARQESLRM